MGQAKRRGTFEQRKAQSAARQQEQDRQLAKEKILREGLRDVARPEVVFLAGSMAAWPASRLEKHMRRLSLNTLQVLGPLTADDVASQTCAVDNPDLDIPAISERD